MGNEGSYGGKIEVRKDGSVLWQVAAREFPKDRDTHGSLEYVIRVVTRDRSRFTSRDGKCSVAVDVPPSELNQIGPPGSDKAKFLIVSGYETPDTAYDTVPVGKSYFITYARYVEAASSQQSPHKQGSSQQKKDPGLCPEDELSDPVHQNNDDHRPDGPPFIYDLSLRYDDYDLDQAGLPFDFDPNKLEVCYQSFVSLRDVYRLYYCKRDILLMKQMLDEIGANKIDKEPFLEKYGMNKKILKFVIVWTLTYRHLRALGITHDLIDDIEHLILPWDDADDRDVLFSRWLSVGPHATMSTGQENQNDAPPRLVNSDINQEDLKATRGTPVITIEANNILRDSGLRTITLRGLNQPGTFILMHHGAPTSYDQRGRAD